MTATLDHDEIVSRMHRLRVRVEYAHAMHPKLSPWELGHLLGLHEDTVRYILDHLKELP